MLIIKIFFLALLIIKILKLAFKVVNPKVLKNIMSFWFYNKPDCFKLYMLFKSLNKRSFLTDQKFFIPNNIFIKIGSLLSFIKFFKYALIILIYFIKNSKSVNMARKIFNDLQYIIRANILLKLISNI